MGILIVSLSLFISIFLFSLGIKEKRPNFIVIAILLLGTTALATFWVHSKIREYDLRIEELSSQNKENHETNLESDSTENDNQDISQNENNSNIKLITKPGEASCFKAELRDENDEIVEVTEEISKVFECLPGGVALSPNGQFLLYMNNLELKIYNIENKNTEYLMTFFETLEGVDCNWYENSQRIACVGINQKAYISSTKIIVIDIDESGSLKGKIDFPQPYEETVDFTCGSRCYPGEFWFESENEIKYHGHNIISPGETFSIVLPKAN